MDGWLPGSDAIDSATALLEPEEFADWLVDRVRRRIPTAAIRLGDGEARLLMLDPNDRVAMDTARETVALETGLSLDSDALLQIKALMTIAFEGADVLGIRFPSAFPSDARTWLGKLNDHHMERIGAGQRRVPLASCLFGHELTEALPDLLRGRRVSVVSCRDLKPLLERWGAEDVVAYQVPSQHRVRDVDGAYEEAMQGTPIWPDIHKRLRRELRVREPGEVFLVGAGFFGKDLCVRIREQGGIAIDMGSALDAIAGKLTRGPGRRILERHADGAPRSEIAAYLRRLYGRSVDEAALSDAEARVFEEFWQTTHSSFDAWHGRPLEGLYSDLRLARLDVDLDTGSGACLIAVADRGGRWEPLGVWWVADDDHSEQAVADLSRRGLIGAAHQHPATLPAEILAPVRQAIETHGSFGDADAARILIYLALTRAAAKQAQGGRGGSSHAGS